MCKVMEELIREEKIEIVENLLGLGSVPAEKIAEATGIPLETVLEIKKELESQK